MTVSEYIFHFLQCKGCDTIFMVSGSSAMWLTDALWKNKKLRAICCHHEQAAAMSADCYGRIKGNIPGVCLVTVGPGAMNAITGVAEAYLDSIPMFVLSGQASSKLLQYEKETGIRQHGTQSINLEPIIKPITKYFVEIMKPEEIRYQMEKAYFEAFNGRKGPVWIDVPVDIQNKQIPNELEMIGYSHPQEKLLLENNQVSIIKKILLRAEKPLILAGFGVRSSDAMFELKNFALKYQIPIVTSRGGIDVIETEDPLFIGRPGSYGDRASHFVIQQCDFLLILGSRLSVSTIGYYPKDFAKNAKKVMIDIDQKELDKSDVPVDFKIHADLKGFLQLLMGDNLINEKRNESVWLKHCQELKKRYPIILKKYEKEEPINSYYFTKLLSDYTKKDAVLVVDTGSVCNIVSQSWCIKEGQRFLISGGLSCMGFWAGSLGAAYAANGCVLALTGDGSMQMNIQELASLQHNKIPVKIFIYNNNGYMLIRHNQHNYMDDRFLGVGPDSGVQTPNFSKVAAAYGIESVRIEKKIEIKEKLKEVFLYEGPIVCEVLVQEFGSIEPRIASKVMPDGSLKAAEFDDLYPFLNEG